ncbi:LacI family DNA-binding transcriptional regulator [Cohnella nanjingensis]|uniref:LacI family DNA-binding transcriptional regulator n=1 Tax=Cohnella nanjingensis TaxID=1387779 RepID=A0A7X0VDC2_9BACL|nr:LacI family DNA-binding transcriptional regulator [Cohnella nanjingensis]MBB6669832.1 LacI family DNA-binding transcriptional regulator [Cohnella nanjingensis]
MKVSIFDVAKKSGLSVVTVSRVLNNSSSVRPKNRDKVLQAMKELDYQPNAAARSLARGKTGIIGLTLSTLHDSFLDAIVKGINDRLAEHGYFLALSVSTGYDESFHRMMFQEDRVDGVILLSPIREDEYVLELKKKKIPFVMLDNQHPGPSAPSVIVDNFKGGYDATRHLIELGHTKIAHITASEIYLSSRERERGFRQALADARLEPYAVERGEFEIPSGYEIASRWIASGRLPTAVFASDDYIALGVMDAFKNEGIRVPGDVSVIGFDDQILASAFRPQLTTVRQPAEKIAKEGVELLLGWINGAPMRNVTIQLEPELVVRASTAPPSMDTR